MLYIALGHLNHDSKSAQGLSPSNCTERILYIALGHVNHYSKSAQGLFPSNCTECMLYIALGHLNHDSGYTLIMADYEDPPNTFFSFTIHGQNIPIFLGIENYSIWAFRMRFFLGVLQALSSIDTDPPRLVTENFLAANIKLTGQALFLMTSKMGDAVMDLATGIETMKKLWLRLLTQYHKKGWGAESILFQKLVYLRHSDCKNSGDYIGKLRGISQRLANMEQICPNWVLVYLLISRLGDKHHN